MTPSFWPRLASIASASPNGEAVFSPHQMCPAAGQGALAIECRTSDMLTRDIVAALDHAPSRFAVTRNAPHLRRWEAAAIFRSASTAPMGNSGWTLTGVVARPDGSQVVRETWNCVPTQDLPG